MKNNLVYKLAALAVLFCWSQGNSSAATADEVETRITEVFEAAQAAFARDPTGLEAQRVLNRSRLVIDTIQPYFYGVPGALHEHSEVRQARVEQVEGWLSEYEPLFVELIGTLSHPGTDSSAVTDYVKFARPTPRLKEALLGTARSESARPENAAAAYDGVFFLQLDDPQIRKEVVGTMEWIDERHSRATLAANLRNMSATLWATPEMLDYWRKSLSVPFLPENFPERGGAGKLVVHYRWAASALSLFGTMDDGTAELARQRAEELRNAGGHERTVDKLIFAAEVLEGVRPPEIAVNWKGQLMGASRNAVKQQKTPKSPVREIGDSELLEEKKNLPNPQSSARTLKNVAKSGPKKWLLLVGAFVVTGIILLLLRATQRKA